MYTEDGYTVVKQVLVVRKDLKMRKGKIGAQCAHASMMSIMQRAAEINKNTFVVYTYPEMHEWLFDDVFTKIVVGVNSEEELLQLQDKCFRMPMPCSLVRDAGKTEFHGEPTYTVLAVGPGEEEDVDKITGHLQLL